MSILIKGIRKPDTCIECKFFVWKRMIGNYCAMDENITFHAVFDGSNVCYERNGDCPIVEIPTPHGQLKDADALADVFRGYIALYDSCPFSQLSFTDKARRDELQSSLAEVINAPALLDPYLTHT